MSPVFSPFVTIVESSMIFSLTVLMKFLLSIKMQSPKTQVSTINVYEVLFGNVLHNIP